MSIDDGLRALIRQNLPRVHWTTVETGLVQRGVPDLYGCDEQMFWVECKSVRRGWRMKFQPAQVGWLARHARQGGRAFVATRRRIDAGKTDELWIHQGMYARELCDDGLQARCAPVLVEHGGPARWDWSAVHSVLMTS